MFQSWTAAQKTAFCPYGKVSSIECVTSDGIASYSTGEIIECSLERGLVCLNADNDPIPCSDYKIRYMCECESKSLMSLIKLIKSCNLIKISLKN